jgi:hypothetical protein
MAQTPGGCAQLALPARRRRGARHRRIGAHRVTYMRRAPTAGHRLGGRLQLHPCPSHPFPLWRAPSHASSIALSFIVAVIQRAWPVLAAQRKFSMGGRAVALSEPAAEAGPCLRRAWGRHDAGGREARDTSSRRGDLL